jgi:hypothetical protein
MQPSPVVSVSLSALGKSTLIAAIAAASLGSDALSLGIEEDITGLRRFSGDVFTGEYRSLDPSGFAARCVDQFHDDRNFENSRSQRDGSK